MRACMSESTSPYVDIARGRREYVAVNEPRVCVCVCVRVCVCLELHITVQSGPVTLP